MQSFTYDQQATRVIFGVGTFDRLAGEVKRLGGLAAGIFSRAVMHVPIETARDAWAAAKRHDADCCVAIGGGSTIGLGKAIALESGLGSQCRMPDYAVCIRESDFGSVCAQLREHGLDPHTA